MFPGISMTPFSLVTEPNKFMTENPTKLFNSLGYYYAVGLMQQMDELEILSNTVFADITEEFEKVKAKFNTLSSKAQQIRSKYSAAVEKLVKTPSESFNKNPCRQLTTSVQSGQESVKMEINNNLVKNLYMIARPAPTLAAWKPLIPDYQNLDKFISNPQEFMNIFRDEMLRDCQNLVNQKHKGEGRKKRDKGDNEAKYDQPLAPMISKVLPLPTLVLQPPPVGKTQGWRSPLEFKTSFTIAGEDVAFASSTVKAATLTTPEQRKRTPRPQPKPIPVAEPTPPPQPARQAPPPSAPPKAAPAPSKAAPAPPKAAPAPPPPPAAPAPPPPPPPPAAPAPPPPPSAPAGLPPPPPPTQNQGGAVSHLDLIKAGNFKLKKADPNAKPKEEVKKAVDPNQLSTGELLQYMASIRAAVKESESEDEDNDESSESW